VPGSVFVITAPSGTGKTTLLKKLLAADPRLRFSISYTTREPRPGEVPGRDYFFVTPEGFRRLRDTGALAGGADLIFDIETRGARALKQAFPQGTFVFVLPPSLEQLQLRLEMRGDLGPGELARRLQQGRGELAEVPWYDFVVVNDDLAVALDQLQAIVTAARCRTALLWPQIKSRFSNL
jgi:guanylate kinase